MRLVALLVLLAVLPTFELAEQLEHVIAHVLDGDAPDHSAHHDEQPSDEHGCTGLVHLCSCHHPQVTQAAAPILTRCIEISASISNRAPALLADLTSLEPAQRPPIA
jgi:hypothetical protein